MRQAGAVRSFAEREVGRRAFLVGLGNHVVGRDEWLITLDHVGWVYYRRLEVVVQSNSVAYENARTGNHENELRANYEMFFRLAINTFQRQSQTDG